MYVPFDLESLSSSFNAIVGKGVVKLFIITHLIFVVIFFFDCFKKSMRPDLQLSDAFTTVHDAVARLITLLEDVIASTLKIFLLRLAHPDEKANVPFREHELRVDSHGAGARHVLIVATGHDSSSFESDVEFA